MSPELVSLKKASEITSLSRTAINKKRKAGEFPAAVTLGEKRIGFVRSEVEDWIAARIAARDAAAAAKRGAAP